MTRAPITELSLWFVGQIVALAILLTVVLNIITRNRRMRQRYFDAAAGAVLLFGGGKGGFKHVARS